MQLYKEHNWNMMNAKTRTVSSEIKVAYYFFTLYACEQCN